MQPIEDDFNEHQAEGAMGEITIDHPEHPDYQANNDVQNNADTTAVNDATNNEITDVPEPVSPTDAVAQKTPEVSNNTATTNDVDERANAVPSDDVAKVAPVAAKNIVESNNVEVDDTPKAPSMDERKQQWFGSSQKSKYATEQNNTPTQQASGGAYSTNPATAVGGGVNNVNMGSLKQPEALRGTGGANLGGSVISGGVEAPVATSGLNKLPPTKKPSGKKRLIIIGVSIFAVLLLVMGVVFGYVIPNQPNNVWKTGMSRTGQEVTGLVGTLTNPATTESFKKLNVKAAAEGSIDGSKININLDTSIDGQDSNTELLLKADNFQNKYSGTAEVNVITQSSSQATIPDVFFKANFSDESLAVVMDLAPGFMPFNNKWISVEQNFIDEIYGQFTTPQTSESGIPEITEEEKNSIIIDANNVTQQYVFTADPEFAVLEVVQFVGTEQSEGIKANNYMVKINAVNAQKYCSAMVDSLAANPVTKILLQQSDEQFAKTTQDAKESCNQEPADDAADSTFNVWIDKKYKIIHKVRFDEDFAKQNEAVIKAKKEVCLAESAVNNNGSPKEEDCADAGKDLTTEDQAYVEFGQIYRGTDETYLFINFISDTNKDKYELKASAYVNIDQLFVKGDFNYKNNQEGQEDYLTITYEISPLEGEVDSAKLESAIPIENAIEAIAQ